jgi:hypothetical protein
MDQHLETLKAAVRAAQKAVDDWEVETDSRFVCLMYDEMLNECNSLIHIGSLTYTPAGVLYAVDRVAYHCGMSDWADSLDKSSFQEYKDLEAELEVAEYELELYEDEQGGAMA